LTDAAENCAPLPEGVRRAILAGTPNQLLAEGQALFTPQQLFGEVEPSVDVLTHAPFLERARAEHEHERDVSARLALGAYLVSRLVDRVLTRDEAAGGQDGLLWQLDAVRRHLRELPPDSPESAHLHGITDAIPLGPEPFAGLRLSLMAYAYFLEHEARLEEAREVLVLAVRTHGGTVPTADFAGSALFAGRLNRLLARWNEATSCYHSAESAACEVGDQVMALRAQLGMSAVMRGRGDLKEAERLARVVLARAVEHSLPEVEAMAYQDVGVALEAQGRRVEAVEAKYQAFLRTGDTLQRMRVLGDLGMGLAELGEYAVARTALEIVAESRSSFLVRTNAIIELMDIESAASNRLSFERRRAAAQSVRDRMPPSMSADFLFKLGVGLARFGQIARARDALSSGLAVAEAHRLNTWYFRFERVLQNLVECEIREPERSTPGRPVPASAVQEMEVGLREYASTVG
jgi:tetratricopeptide (TPR) repeat protein